MKKCTAIICEYNPLHNGHSYQLKNARDDSDIIICIMSGNTVQRGGFSVCDKYERAEIAIKMGADIVIEHPFPYCMSSAADFASSGVFLANAFKADTLCFGHESDSNVLLEIAALLSNDSSKENILKIQKANKSLSFPKAREKFVEESLGDEKASFLKKPNNILSVEYLMNIRKYKNISPKFIQRNLEFNSATEIRRKIFENENIYNDIPIKSIRYFNPKKIDLCIISFLNLCGEYTDIYDCDSSLYYRILSFAKKVRTVEELIEACTTSAYTSSKVRRGIYSIFFGTKNSYVKSEPKFSILLGASKVGTDYLSKNKKYFDIPLLTTVSASKKNNINLDFAFKPDKLYSLFNDEEYTPFKKPYF